MSRSQGVDARRHVIIAILLTVLLATALATSGCGEQAARMEQNQVRLQAMIMANARQLSTISSQMDRGQKLTDQAFAKVDQGTQEINAQVRTVQREQAQLQAALLDGNQEIGRKIAQLQRNQTHLKDGVAQVGNIAQSTNAAVTAVARDQATLHQLVQDNKHELAGKQDALQQLAQDNNKNVVEHLATLASNQHQLGADVGNLHSLSQTVATDVTTLGTQQTVLQNALNNNTATLADKIALLEQHQLDVQSIIDRVANTTSHTANDVTALAAVQAEMQQTQGTHHAALNATLGTITQDQQSLQTGIDTLDQKADQTTTHLTNLTAGQDAIQETMQANNASVVDDLTSLSNSHRALHEDVKTLDHSAEAIAADLGNVITSQLALQGKLAESNEQFAAFSENQTTLQQSINHLDNKADVMASNVSSIATELSSVSAGYETLAKGQRDLSGSIDHVSETTKQVANDQRAVQETVNTVMATTSLLSLNTVTMSNRQAEFEQEVRTELTDLSLGTDQLVTGQGTLNQALQKNNETLSGQIASLATDQATLQSNIETASSQMTHLTQGQQNLESGLDTLTATTTQVALDVIAMDDNQDNIQKAVQANGKEITTQLSQVSQGQAQMQSGLDTLTATTTQVALDVITLDDNQSDIQKAVQTNGKEITTQLSQVSQSQAQVQSGLDTLTATTTQVALDVITLDGNQAKQGKAMQASQHELASTLTTVVQDQEQVKNTLDTVTATTSQVALDVITLDDNQAKLEQAVQANRQELVAKLAEIAQGQQQWLARFDAAQTQVETMTAGITALEQRVTRLQGTLHASLQDLSTLLDTESQQRVRFEESVRQDMQGVADTISQLREVQASLAEHIQGIQDSSQSQTGDILSALEQLQLRTDTEVSAVDTGMKSSKASPQEIMLP